MSFASVNDPADVAPALPSSAPKAEEPTKMKYKSYKKKFQKMRHHFKDRMRENSRLYEEEQHATRIARRLQEQNDQLLDLLLDVNANHKLPPHLRYDLRSPTPNISDVPGLEPDVAPVWTREVEGARAVLREARLEFGARQISLQEYKHTETSLMRIIDAPQTPNALKTLKNLCQISHTKLASVPAAVMPTELVDESPTGYLSPAHEEEYLSTLDNYIANAPADSQLPLPRRPRPTEKEREKDIQLHNPVSVYNWLRAHSDNKSVPHDLEKDAPASNTNPSEQPIHKGKASPKPPSTGTGSTKPTRKRASSALIPKQEPEEEILDEEGYVIGGDVEVYTSKGKRKRENDDAYRPKGGSSKSRKRTKGSSGTVVKRLEPEVEEEEGEA